MNEKEFNKYVDEMCKSIDKLLENHEEELIFIITLIKTFNQVCEERRKLEQQVKKQKEVIDKAINFLKKWGEEPDADMYIQMKEYKEFNELLDILKEVSE